MAVTIYGSKQLIVQIVQTVSTTQQTMSTTAFTELTSLNTAITPSNSSNKILVCVNICFGADQDSFPAYRIYRGGTWIDQSTLSSPATQTTFGGSVPNGGTGTSAIVQMGNVNFNYLDSPATVSSTTYSIQVSPMRTVNRAFYLNRAVSLGDANQLTATSTMTLYEVAYA